MNMGLFDLSIFENAGPDDLLQLKLTEGNDEFLKNCNTKPDNHFDPRLSGNKQIPVPGGDGESPKAKPGYNINPAPSGLGEKPSTSFRDFGPTVSNGVTLDSDTYNDAVDQLKKSFKECYDLMATLTSARVVDSPEKNLLDMKI